MTDDQKANETPVKETQESPVPSEEQKTTDEPSIEQEAPQEESAQTKEGLPESAKERTKEQFEKLQTQLREERKRREQAEIAFRAMRTPQQKAELPPLVDPETGLYNDKAQLERDRLLREAQARAAKAEEAVQRVVTEQENRAMFQAHPELDPSSESYDRELHNVTSALLLKSMVDPDDFGGKQLSGVEAGKMAKKLMNKKADVSRQEGRQEALESITPKEQAALEESGSSGRRSQVAPKLDELRVQSRRTDSQGMDAVMERLKNIPDKS